MPEDKHKIKELLKKPWNPYILRHSSLTEKSKILKEHILRQHAGWSIGSQMPQKYLHYYGNESNQSLLEAYGIVTTDQQLTDLLKPKQCPNCSEPNKPDSKFCVKCRMVHNCYMSNRFRELLEKYKEYLPKVDPALINDLLFHQMENPSVTPLYMVEIFTKYGTNPEQGRIIIREKTGMNPAIIL